MPPITAQLLAAVAEARVVPLMAQLAPEFGSRLPAAGIDTPLRIAHFLAQASVETWNFSRLEEDLNYGPGIIAATFPKLASRAAGLARNPQGLADAAYAGKNGNGDETSGDGWRFRGRGCLGLTGRFNYGLIGNRVGAALVDNPDLVAEPHWAVATAVAFWNLRACNAAADADDGAKLTRLINGGTNGLSDRLARKHRALALLKANSE